MPDGSGLDEFKSIPYSTTLIGRPGLSRVKGTVGPRTQRISHRQSFVVSFKQLERRRIGLGGGVRYWIHVKLEIERVGG